MNRCIEPTIHTIRALDNFSSWLLHKLEETGMSYGDLAKEIGVSRQTIGDYCRKEYYPKLDILTAIFSYFGEDCIRIPLDK